MSDLQNAVEQLRAQARAFRAVIRVADAIEGITSLDQAAAEAEQRKAAALALEASEGARIATNLDVLCRARADVEQQVADAKAEAVRIIDDAKAVAERTIEGAESKVGAVLQAGEAAAAGKRAEIEAMTARLAVLTADAEAAERRLAAAHATLEEIKGRLLG